MHRCQRALSIVALLIANTIWTPARAESGSLYLVFFSEFSANITPQGRKIIGQAAAHANRLHAKTILIEARANATGSPDATMKIAETRAAVVRDMLVADGVPETVLQLDPIGQAGTKDTGVGHRTVEIIFKK